MQRNLINCLADTIRTNHFPCEWRIEWFKQKRVIELVLLLPFELPAGKRIKDRYNQSNIDETFVYEDAVLLYDPLRGPIENNNYLTTIPFDHPDGMYGGTIEALCKTLRLSVAQAKANQVDFVEDDHVVRFEMNWNESNFKERIQTLKDTGRFDTVLYGYPSDITEEVENSDEME